ncbi:hypothetical protein ScPMuIL_015060 [Solemya velum]
MRLHRKRVDPTVRIINLVMISGFSSSVLNSTMLIISTAAGEWLLGDVACQIYALFSHVSLVGATWMLSLAAWERCYKLVAPGDHPAMFSQINLKILLVGLYMLIFLLCIGPIYGWGEYSNYKGKLDMVVMVSPITVNVSENHFMTSTPSGGTRTADSGDGTSQIKCPSFTDIAQLLSAYLQSRTDVKVRKFFENPQRNMILFSLRTPSNAPIEKLYGIYIENFISKEMTEVISDTFPNAYCENRSTLFETSVTINESEYKQYKEVFVTFQSLGICSIDFTNVNQNLDTWLVFMFISMVAIPYGTLFLSTFTVLFLRNCIGTEIMTAEEIKHVKLLTVGGFFSLVCCAPYYAVNLANARGQIFHVIANFTVTFLFYNSTSTVPILYILTNIPTSRRKFKPKPTTHNTSSIEANGDAIEQNTSGSTSS